MHDLDRKKTLVNKFYILITFLLRALVLSTRYERPLIAPTSGGLSVSGNSGPLVGENY